MKDIKELEEIIHNMTHEILSLRSELAATKREVELIRNNDWKSVIVKK